MTNDVTKGITTLIQVAGLGGLRHNTILLTWPKEWRKTYKTTQNVSYLCLVLRLFWNSGLPRGTPSFQSGIIGFSSVQSWTRLACGKSRTEPNNWCVVDYSRWWIDHLTFLSFEAKPGLEALSTTFICRCWRKWQFNQNGKLWFKLSTLIKPLGKRYTGTSIAITNWCFSPCRRADKARH